MAQLSIEPLHTIEKQPPAGFRDVTEDTSDLVPHNFKRMRHQDVMGERRDDLERVIVTVCDFAFDDSVMVCAFSICSPKLCHCSRYAC